MNIQSRAIYLLGFIIVTTWVGRFIWDSSRWEMLENISLGLFALLLSGLISRDVKASNREKKASSKLMQQICFLFPPKPNHEAPFKVIGVMGHILGVVGLVLLMSEAFSYIGK